MWGKSYALLRNCAISALKSPPRGLPCKIPSPKINPGCATELRALNVPDTRFAHTLTEIRKKIICSPYVQCDYKFIYPFFTCTSCHYLFKRQKKGTINSCLEKKALILLWELCYLVVRTQEKVRVFEKILVLRLSCFYWIL